MRTDTRARPQRAAATKRAEANRATDQATCLLLAPQWTREEEDEEGLEVGRDAGERVARSAGRASSAATARRERRRRRSPQRRSGWWAMAARARLRRHDRRCHGSRGVAVRDALRTPPRVAPARRSLRCDCAPP